MNVRSFIRQKKALTPEYSVLSWRWQDIRHGNIAFMGLDRIAQCRCVEVDSILKSRQNFKPQPRRDQELQFFGLVSIFIDDIR